MQERVFSVMIAAIILGVSGCHSSHTAPTVGDRLPITSSSSVALPGAVDTADAPRAPAVAESRTDRGADNLVEYRDDAHGVSFQYPSVWRPSQTGTGDLGQPDFAQVAPKAIITQVFNSKGNYYEDTVLDSLSFSYTVQRHTSAAACAAIPGKALQNAASSSPVTYNGRQFSESHGGDAGMCHHLAATVDTTLQGIVCYIFERDTMTTCPYVKTKTTPRPLTSDEQTSLARHLDAIMKSVQISDTGR